VQSLYELLVIDGDIQPSCFWAMHPFEIYWHIEHAKNRYKNSQPDWDGLYSLLKNG
jgi:hypothetical protein